MSDASQEGEAAWAEALADGEIDLDGNEIKKCTCPKVFDCPVHGEKAEVRCLCTGSDTGEPCCPIHWLLEEGFAPDTEMPKPRVPAYRVEGPTRARFRIELAGHEVDFDPLNDVAEQMGNPIGREVIVLTRDESSTEGAEKRPTIMERTSTDVVSNVIRDLAIAVVDRQHGYTYEFASDKEQHADEYDAVENAIRVALQAEIEALYTPN